MIGKVIGGGFGLLLGGLFGSSLLGLMLGIWLGHRFDCGLAALLKESGVWQFGFNQTHSDAQQIFFDVTFSVMGHLAKSDGVVSAREIQTAEQMMARLNMGVVARKAAMEAFRRGKQPGFDCDAACLQFRTMAQHHVALIQLFLDIQLQVALADGPMSAQKKRLFNRICSHLNVASPHFNQRQYQRQTGSQTTSGPTLTHAYRLLEVKPDASDDAVKKAYRKQMSAHHPDRLMAKGLPE